MALDTKAKRAAALGFGTLALVLPVAAGALDIPAAGQALGAYVWDYEDSDIIIPRLSVVGRYPSTIGIVGRLEA